MAINEDTSFIEYNVEQPTQDFVTNFDTIGGTTDVVLVTVDGVLTDTPESSYTVQQINLTTWRVTPEVQTGSVVRLYRVTNTDEMMHVFTAGAKFIARNMDNNFKQIRHSQQEVHDDFSSLAANTSLRLNAFSDSVDALNSEFISTQDVVSNLVSISADTVNTANNALNTANAIDAKASTALSNSSTALSTATGIDAKATDALDNSLAAVLDSSAALNTANGIDAKATQALTDSTEALSSATTALSTANAIDGKATQALTNSTGALKSSNNLSDLASATTARANLGVMSASEVTTAIANATPTIPDATETVAGKAKIATTAIAQAGVNDTDIITPLKLQQKLTSTVFGEGQTWQNVTGSRSSGTTYTNNTGKPICVKVSSNFTSSGNTLLLYVNEVEVQRIQQDADGSVNAWADLIVPPESSYRITSSNSFSNWSELR